MTRQQFDRFNYHAEVLLDSKYRRDREYGEYLKDYLDSIDPEQIEKASEPIPYNYYFM